MNILEFRKGHLSDRIINALIESTRTYAEMEVLLNEYPYMVPVLSDILLSIDIYYSLHDAQPDINQIVQSLYIPDQSTPIARTSHAISACIKYAKNKIHKMDVLTAGDLLKIDQTIKTANIMLLTTDELINKPEQQLKEIWSILHDLYGPNRQYPLLLETALALYGLATLPDDYRLSLNTKIILFSSLYKSNLAFSGLQRQWTLLTDPRVDISSIKTDDAIVHILHVFQNMWKYTTTLMRSLNNKRIEIAQNINFDTGKQMPNEIHWLLVENICIKNQDASAKMRVSPKTAIKYLKLLEQQDLLYFIKKGREIFYFSRLLLDFLKQQAEEYTSGT